MAWHSQTKSLRGKVVKQSYIGSAFSEKNAYKMNELKLLPNQIYHADGSTLLWKLLPDRQRNLSTRAKKLQKESNFSRLLVIGKAKILRDFKNANIPVEYHSTKNAWMTSAFFVEWCHRSFFKQVFVQK